MQAQRIILFGLVIGETIGGQNRRRHPGQQCGNHQGKKYLFHAPLTAPLPEDIQYPAGAAALFLAALSLMAVALAPFVAAFALGTAAD